MFSQMDDYTAYIVFCIFEFRGVAKNGELIDFEACMDIMDLLYEKEETSVLYSSPRTLAASTLACFIIPFYFLFSAVANLCATIPVPLARLSRF